MAFLVGVCNEPVAYLSAAKPDDSDTPVVCFQRTAPEEPRASRTPLFFWAHCPLRVGVTETQLPNSKFLSPPPTSQKQRISFCSFCSFGTRQLSRNQNMVK